MADLNFPGAKGWDDEVRDSPYRLRFELGGETHGTDTVTRFIRAFDRAREITSSVLPPKARTYAVVKTFRVLHFRTLHKRGFDPLPVLAEWAEPARTNDPDSVSAYCRSFDITHNTIMRDVLIWCPVAAEMDIKPRISVHPYFFAPDHKILIHIYDDRGMDVISTHPDKLLPLYKSHESWLLDYDRKRMRKAFGS
ncbi:MAG: DUF3885 domain-containing protein [Beijerinckiaceae bacterium]|jgi:hypothetical protein|nr:DUF3885 domain-containing protein [Beijerinckiaceae bacterium]